MCGGGVPNGCCFPVHGLYTPLPHCTQPRFRNLLYQPDDAATMGRFSTRQPDGAGSCGLEWSPLVSQLWLLESTSGRPLSGIGSCREHRRGVSWLCPEAPSPACPAPPPCPALLWRSAVCLGAGQCQTCGCCCVWSVHSIEGPSLGLGVPPGRGSGCPPGRSEEEPHPLPHLLAVALLPPTRR